MLYILIIIVSAIAQYLGPWWTMPIVCFVLCFWKSTSAKGAASVSAAAISTLWLGYALFQNYVTEGVILNKIAGLFPMNNPTVLFVLMTLIGALVSASAGVAGYHCRKAIGFFK